MNRIVISGVCRGLLDGEQKNQGRLNPTIALADSEVVPVLNRRVRTGSVFPMLHCRDWAGEGQHALLDRPLQIMR